MENFKLGNELTGEIKKVVREYLRNSKILSEEQKKQAVEELSENWFDERFESDKFISEAIGYSVCKWKEQNFNLAELWKSIAIENSKINNAPHLVANDVLEEFKKQFNLNL